MMALPKQLPSFWENFENVAATHPDVMKHVTAHLSKDGGAAHLRGASRGVRQALNRTVTTVRWTQRAPFGGVEMATVFREAHRLHVSSVAQIDDDISASSPLLLAKIQHLQLHISDVPRTPADVGSVAALLSR
jgi:hypothetical protein